MKVPSSFSISKIGQGYSFRIPHRNPIWVVISILLILGGVSLLLHIPLLGSVMIFLGGIKLLLEYQSHTLLSLEEDCLWIDNVKIPWDELKGMRLKYVTHRGSGRVANGEWRTVSIVIKTANGKCTVGSSLIEEYQQVVINLVSRYRKKDYQFFDELLEKEKLKTGMSVSRLSYISILKWTVIGTVGCVSFYYALMFVVSIIEKYDL